VALLAGITAKDTGFVNSLLYNDSAGYTTLTSTNFT
jgi:hypothetical protein